MNTSFWSSIHREKVTFTSQISENSGIQLAELFSKNCKACIFLCFLYCKNGNLDRRSVNIFKFSKTVFKEVAVNITLPFRVTVSFLFSMVLFSQEGTCLVDELFIIFSVFLWLLLTLEKSRSKLFVFTFPRERCECS